MKKHLVGLDILRGIGIFCVVGLHSAFYYFGGLFAIDLANPPVLVTVIGLLLMFAGLFAVISGLVHNLQWENRWQDRWKLPDILQHQLKAGGFILVVSYLYFLFTGPGLVDFGSQSFDNSILVELIRNSTVTGISLDRMLYVDSLVMLGLNTILCGLTAGVVSRLVPDKQKLAATYLTLGIGFFLVSMVRIPLYPIYTRAVAANQWPVALSLNWLVNKNNPVFPYLAFGITGMWLAVLIRYGDMPGLLKKVLPVAIPLLLAGVVSYILLPDTMLERGIDGKWYSIMLAQLGLFPALAASFIYYYDVRRQGKGLSWLSRFFYRFGVAGFTVFFLESVVSAVIFTVIRQVNPGVSFSIGQALLYGLSLALAWGGVLVGWEQVQYKYGLEYWYALVVGRHRRSTKGEKLRGYLWG